MHKATDDHLAHGDRKVREITLTEQVSHFGGSCSRFDRQRDKQYRSKPRCGVYQADKSQQPNHLPSLGKAHRDAKPRFGRADAGRRLRREVGKVQEDMEKASEY